MDNFSKCLTFTLLAEGGYTKVASDPGNWTGGAVGRGELRGTKYGINAAAYPDLDIVDLSEGNAQAICRRDYYDKIAGDMFELPVTLVLFDGAVNAGIRRAVTWLQQAVNLPADGVLGVKTVSSAKAAEPIKLAYEMLARRADYYARLPTWPEFGLGWSRRIIALSGSVSRCVQCV